MSAPLRLLIVTDAWAPQVNGVVRTLSTMTEMLRAHGDTVEVIGPDRFNSLPMPGYKEIRLAVAPRRKLARLVDAYMPCAVHIATEGPLGWAMRGICLRRNWPFTTAFHTKFAEYLKARAGVPAAWSWRVLRHFHAPAQAVMAATPSLRRDLAMRGFTRVRPWTRGVDLSRFRPEPREPFDGLPRPIFLYAGRVAVEKNLAAFLALDLPGTKVVIGDGPQRAELQRRYPAAQFLGYRENGQLARSYAGADVFVFPSRTDTFGLVLLEALASGTPVAAFPVTGPLDVVTDPRIGVLDEDLRAACLRALSCSRDAARSHAEAFSWKASMAQFRETLVRFGG
ncbi:glycosyltransferase family 4 protein [Belnapia rosea]|uniref:Glycosyltransferase involved in cell wall bisynthesis n=1 Tax=Belnapia rosea TaxID=938405 RepID=A0A1G6KTZ8_9PROT|nr:glycosyltransferase family 1 protein [Belnapia rosea]SDC34407.1 Glycosyltransferase involved in cell wall bisynthesis [Belnapia rosea]